MSVSPLPQEKTGDTVLTQGMDRKIAAPRWKKQMPFIAGGVVVLTVGAFLIFAPAPGRTLKVENSHVSVSTVAKGAFEDFIPIRSRVAPLNTVYLDAIEGGRVEKIYVEDGAMLKAGDPIVDLSNTALQLDVIAREAEVTEQLNNLRTIELTLERDRLQHERDLVELDYQVKNTGRTLERRRELVKTGAVSKATLEGSEDEYEYFTRKRAAVQESQRTNARLQRDQMTQLKESTMQLQRNLQFARRNLESLNVRAPADGKLTAFNVEIGQSLGQGTRLGQLDDPSRYKLTADVDEYYLGRVDVEQPATLVVGSKTYNLKIVKTYPQVRDGKFNVDLAFIGDAPSDIRRGQTLQLKLTLGDTTEALLIPDGAFYQDTGGGWVFVVAPNGSQAVRRNVRLGRRNARFIEVLDGLEPGEKVVTSPYTGFLDKERLELTP